MTAHGDPGACFTDFALEEYVQGRLDPEIRAEVDAHIVKCSECGRGIDLLKSESELLGQALLASPRPTGSDQPDELTLAAYLDGALDHDATRKLESGLVADSALLASLVRLSREVEATLSDPGTGARQRDEEVPAGQILRMPARTAMPAVIASAGLKFGDGRSA